MTIKGGCIVFQRLNQYSIKYLPYLTAQASAMSSLSANINYPLPRKSQLNTATMGWNQWAFFCFNNKTNEDTLKLKFPEIRNHWGWPFADTKDTYIRTPIRYDEIEDKEIGPQTSYSYGQTAKQNEWAGMEGTVEIWTKNATGGLGEKVAKVYYSCPWSGSNKFSITDKASGWNIDSWGADYSGDALGSISIEVKRA
jgi:hypothetical protein